MSLGNVEFVSLKGLVPYLRASQLQEKLVELRHRDLRQDTVLFLEHAPVFTQGQGLQRGGSSETLSRHMPLKAPLPEGYEQVKCSRGGDWTYHGPGQLVIYPIVKLNGTGLGPDKDLHLFIRRLEEVFIEMLTDFGVARVGRKQSASGVWVGDKKIASIGIAIRKWISWHGIALNVVNDLSPFQWISPCGFDSTVMTRLEDFLPSIPASQTPWSELGWRFFLESELVRKLAPYWKLNQYRQLDWQKFESEVIPSSPRAEGPLSEAEVSASPSEA